MKRKAKKQLGRVIVNAIGSFLCCSIVLGVSMVFFSYGLNMTEEMFRHRAMLTLSNIVFLSMLFTAQDILQLLSPYDSIIYRVILKPWT